MKKGEIREYDSYVLVCGGAYWDWPLWRRVLANCGKYPYAAWCVTRETPRWLRWRREYDDSFRGRLFWMKFAWEAAKKRIVPIYWTMPRDDIHAYD